jgi:tripartite motif-containing protein 71
MQGTGNGQFSNPSGLAVNSAGTTVYASDYNNNNVQIFTSSDGINYAYSSQWGTPYGSTNFEFKSPEGLTTNSSGDIYVTDVNNSRIMEYDPTGTTFIAQFGFFSSNPTNGDLVAPAAVGVDGTGNVYVADLNTGALLQSVAKYASTGSWLTYWNASSNAFGVAANSAGTTIYVSTSSAVEAYNNTGTTLYESWTGSSSGKAFSSVYGLAVDSSGNVYVADYGNNRIVKFDYAGNYSSQLGSLGTLPGQLQGPFAVAVDGSNNVYVDDKGNYRIQKFPPMP